jgi:dTDP-4-dehydrorhamnose reductase
MTDDVMRILLFGKNGQLGWELHRSFLPLGDVISIDQEDLDLEDSKELIHFIREANPTVIVNASAYTAVDRAELEPEKARAVNSLAPGIMAEEANRLGAFLIHFSTDYVFDGRKGKPYKEQDKPNPINVYGQSKLEGEQIIKEVGTKYLILRTSWLYSLRNPSFPTKVLKWAREKESLQIVNDQIGSPTWARSLAETTEILLAKCAESSETLLSEQTGIYHVTGGGYTSRFDWARLILELDPKPEEHIFCELQPALSSDFPTPAERPLFTALDCSKFREEFTLQLPNWQETLRMAMETAA